MSAHQQIHHCRACGSQNLKHIMHLGDNLEYAICDSAQGEGCGLVQQVNLRPFEASGNAQDIDTPHAPVMISRHVLRSVITEALEMVSTRDGAALDLGMGDDTLMMYYPRWIDAYGAELHQECTQASEHGQFIKKPFLNIDVHQELNVPTKFDIITMVHMLDKCNNPVAILRHMKNMLARDGVGVIEVPYLSLSLMRNNVGVFNKQNATSFSLESLEYILRLANLKIVRGTMTSSSGGSIRVFVTHQDYMGHDYVPWLEQLAQLWDEEKSLNLAQGSAYNAFMHRAAQNKDDFGRLLLDIKQRQEHIQVIGFDNYIQQMMNYYNLDASVVSAFIDPYSDHQEDPVAQYTQVSYQTDSLPIDVISTSNCHPDYYLTSTVTLRETLERYRDAVFSGSKIIILGAEINVIDDSNYGAALGQSLATSDTPGNLDTLKAILSASGRPKLVAVNSVKKTG